MAKRPASFPVSHSRDDVQQYVRRPLSNREGFRRLEKSLEKIAVSRSNLEKLCEVCGRRTRAYRMVPATFGHPIASRASFTGALKGKFVIACDNGPDGCAAMLTRSGVQTEGVREQQAMERLGLVHPSPRMLS